MTNTTNLPSTWVLVVSLAESHPAARVELYFQDQQSATEYINKLLAYSTVNTIECLDARYTASTDRTHEVLIRADQVGGVSLVRCDAPDNKVVYSIVRNDGGTNRAGVPTLFDTYEEAQVWARRIKTQDGVFIRKLYVSPSTLPRVWWR